ncbi:OmpA family protein [Lyngbya aestuarii]|uniref:OmpA family protein n=1 Tax=Lyngbya aestuarii TaxID=118322 RepID=UPI00403D9907
MNHKIRKIPSFTELLSLRLSPFLCLLAVPSLATAQSIKTTEVPVPTDNLREIAQISVTEGTPLRVVVNSNQDGAIQPDNDLTLREAITLVNGQLGLDSLSEAERSQIATLTPNERSRIEFNLPPGQTTISLREMLPPLATAGLLVDGTTQAGYDTTSSATAEIAIPIPVVEITPAPQTQVLRGLTIVADGVTVRGLSLYGFRELRGATLSTPPADIFISHPNPPPDTRQPQPPNPDFPFYPENTPPQDVLIENNWLGIPPDESLPQPTSAFGVSVFNSLGTTIRGNRIAYHEGSGIITSVQAENLSVTQNIIVGNGLAGMPDAIRLEGMIDNSQISGNLICGNDGSGVYLFKPSGAVEISNNQISFNGRRLRRAAIYLMGDDHQVVDNQILYQTGPGVVVTAYPRSQGNLIEGNRFAALEGMSIDLVTQQHVEPIHFQVGDGPNPRRNSPNRRKETGNAAIDAPEFVSDELFVIDSKVVLLGQAEPGSIVEIYRVREQGTLPYGPLNESLGVVNADEEGNFRVNLQNLQAGERLSAIATLPEFGTSEAALNTVLVTAEGEAIPGLAPPEVVTPVCTTPPAPPTPEPPPPPPPEPLVLRVPRNVHFALDQATIAAESAVVLEQIAQVLREYPFLTVELVGHTDPRASDAYNLDLGRRRALAVRNYLLQAGIAAERMTIRSLGEQQRRADGTERLDYARDRRVEVIFQDTRGLEIIFERQETDLQLEPPGGSR